MNKGFTRTLAALTLLLATSVVPPGPAAAADGEIVDSWSASVTLRTSEGWYPAPVHASLLPDGTVHMFGVRRSNWPPTPSDKIRRFGFLFSPEAYGATLPAELIADQVLEPVEFPFQVDGNQITTDDLICAGHTLLADGTVITVGGTRTHVTTDGATFSYDGLPSQTVYDGTTWSRIGDTVATTPSGSSARWYPTVMRLPDERILIISGFESVTPVPAVNLTTEVYDPATGTNTVASPFGTTPPEVLNSDYTHAWVLPYPNAKYDILMFGEVGVPVMTDTEALDQWQIRRASQRPGAAGPADRTNIGTTSAMLPIRVDNGEWGYSNGSVIMAAGSMGTEFLTSVDVYDPAMNEWLPEMSLPGPRHHPNSVVLPDGRILLLGGHNTAGDDTVQQAVYIDPANGFDIRLGASAMGITRGYHTTSVLLPDGRVLVSGGRDSETKTSQEKPSYQYYEPDYMTKTRPQIAVGPDTLDYGGLFFTGSVGPKPAEAVLVSLASQTHSWDSNQRVIELPIGAVFDHSSGGYVSIIGDPVNTHQVPPGQYMLFLLDADRVPSTAKMVSVQP